MRERCEKAVIGGIDLYLYSLGLIRVFVVFENNLLEFYQRNSFQKVFNFIVWLGFFERVKEKEDLQNVSFIVKNFMRFSFYSIIEKKVVDLYIFRRKKFQKLDFLLEDY